MNTYYIYIYMLNCARQRSCFGWALSVVRVIILLPLVVLGQWHHRPKSAAFVLLRTCKVWPGGGRREGGGEGLITIVRLLVHRTLGGFGAFLAWLRPEDEQADLVTVPERGRKV